MKNTIKFCLATMLLFSISCSNEPITDSNLEIINNDFMKSGSTQISGLGIFASEPSQCDSENEGGGAHFALLLTGDLEGCLYVFVEDHECSPSGTYREVGSEYFVGTYKGESGTFRSTYRFEAKFEGCDDGFFLGAEIFGRCQHPIQKGSGTGVFDGVTGRLDFKDNVEDHSFPYTGHLKF